MKIALIPNYHKENIMEAAKHTVQILLANGHDVFVHEQIGESFPNVNIVKKHAAMADFCDMFIAIGGDGTIIHAAKHSKGKPILGINMGRLGYMSGLEYDDIESLPSILNGECNFEQRMLIDIKSGDKLLASVLNDGVISAKLSKLLDFTVCIDDSEFHYRADGLITSTPTGSTAYSLSAGGPVVDPTINCMIFTPICPHSLFNRSLVLCGKTLLKVKVNLKYNETVILTMDGEKPYTIKKNEEITFTQSEKYVTLVMKKKKNFFQLVNKKLLIPDNNF